MFLSPKWDMDEPFPGGVSVSHFVVFVDLFWQKKDDSFVDLTFYGMTQNLFFSTDIHQLNIDQIRLFD